MTEHHPNAKYVVLRGIKHGNVFWTTNDERDPTLLADGTVAYEVLGYADTEADAIGICNANSNYYAAILDVLKDYPIARD